MSEHYVDDDVWAVLTVWMEARGEPYDGKVAVARVIRNRMGGTQSAADVVLNAYQFSCWNTTDPNRLAAAKARADDPQMLDSARAWQDSMVRDAGVGRSWFYYNPAAVTKMPEWAKPDRRTAIIGRHQFFLG